MTFNCFQPFQLNQLFDLTQQVCFLVHDDSMFSIRAPDEHRARRSKDFICGSNSAEASGKFWKRIVARQIKYSFKNESVERISVNRIGSVLSVHAATVLQSDSDEKRLI